MSHETVYRPITSQTKFRNAVVWHTPWPLVETDTATMRLDMEKRFQGDRERVYGAVFELSAMN